MNSLRQFLQLRVLVAGLLIASSCGAAVRPDLENGLIDTDDWLEQHSYNPERDAILEIGAWNRRELQGHWPETQYSYWDWDQSGSYGEEEEPD